MFTNKQVDLKSKTSKRLQFFLVEFDPDYFGLKNVLLFADFLKVECANVTF